MGDYLELRERLEKYYQEDDEVIIKQPGKPRDTEPLAQVLFNIL